MDIFKYFGAAIDKVFLLPTLPIHPITPEEGEMVFTATQKFDDIEATLTFVIREGQMYIIKAERRFVMACRCTQLLIG